MNGPSRVRLQKRSEIREIVSDIDQLKLCHSMSAIEILTPRAEVMLRLGNKSKICLKLCYHHWPGPVGYSITLQYPMRYPFEPLEILEIQLREEKKNKSEGQVEVEMVGIHEDGLEHSEDKDDERDAGRANERMNQETLEHIQHLGQEYANNHIGEDGYSVSLISYLNSLLNPSHQQSRTETDSITPSLPSAPPQEEIPLPYKCRSCRRILFYSCHIQHNPIHLISSLTSSKPCTSIFLHEIPFIDETVEEDQYVMSVRWIQDLSFSSASADGNGISGKIACPSCHAKVGSWSWSDSQCSCGKWFVPSLQFTVTKVDPPVTPSSKNDPTGLHPQDSSMSLPFVGTMEELGLGDGAEFESMGDTEEKGS